ncbi:hypothetical protein ACTOS9_13010 [Bacillus subtilis]|uniref:Uncharacterized protein n=1 Tax=Bacillus subtilis TaxID=1423 RepID=A0AAX3RF27_BACIU|nr:hypothetical protein P5633_11615 [Bacillus subtilis]WGD61892.1 hypothetical protein P5648_13275 [Bacillus subtilis]WGD72232.1 hypothetical protein P5645_09165 [Bacillus subtilis]WGD74987.1 hypothetical protein P5631_13595 [Bacillus subtilis]
MTRRTWRKGDLLISYGNPIITTFGADDEKIESMRDVIYFYYDITILHGKKTIFSASTHDFPKVPSLPAFLEHILTFDMTKGYALERTEDGGFVRNVDYAQLVLEDAFGMDNEYYYKIERYDYSVKQEDEESPKKWSEYTLTIGRALLGRDDDGVFREDFGEAIVIKYLTAEELMALKSTAEAFCEAAIRDYNESVEVAKT